MQDYNEEGLQYMKTNSSDPFGITSAASELNLKYIRTVMGDVNRVLQTSTHVTLYKYFAEFKRWENTGIQGCMFLTTTDSSALSLILLNRTNLHKISIFKLELKESSQSPLLPWSTTSEGRILMKGLDAIYSLWFLRQNEFASFKACLQDF